MSEFTIKAIDSFLHKKVLCIIQIYFHFADFMIDNYDKASWQKLFNLFPGRNGVSGFGVIPVWLSIQPLVATTKNFSGKSITLKIRNSLCYPH